MTVRITKADLVVVGSSAGGVGALSTLVSTVHKNFPAPIVIAQHLDPQRQSHLGAILERRSNLPIVTVDERSPTPLETGKIYPAQRSRIPLPGGSPGDRYRVSRTHDYHARRTPVRSKRRRDRPLSQSHHHEHAGRPGRARNLRDYGP